MPAPRGSASFGSSKIIISTTRLVGDTRTSQNAGVKKKRKWRRTCKESRPRFNIFHSFSSGDAIFEGGCPSSLSPPLSPSHRGGSLTSTLLAMTSIHRPTAPRMRSYNLLFRTTFYAHRGREKKKKKEAAVLVELRVCLRHIGAPKSNSKQIHADIPQLQMHIFKWRRGARRSV